VIAQFKRPESEVGWQRFADSGRWLPRRW